jgi:hypothetical protein
MVRNILMIGSITVITLNVLQYSYKLSTNKINKGQFIDSCIKDMFITSYSLVAGGITAGLTGSFVFGYMLGSFLGSMAATFIYNTSYKSFISFCCDTGFTFFGLVDQDYELPVEILEEIGVNVFEYDKFFYDKFEYNKFEFEKVKIDNISVDRINIRFLRCGLIEINKIGYIY